jgi:hypothetical protein
MNLLRIVLAGFGAFVAYFIVGGLAFGLLPSLKTEFLRYPAVYRPQEGQFSHMPVGMAAMLVSILPLAVIYAMRYQTVSGIADGARSGAIFGVLIGIFALGAFVVHNYVNLQIGVALTLQQGIIYFVEWVAVGTVIGLIYRPVA